MSAPSFRDGIRTESYSHPHTDAPAPWNWVGVGACDGTLEGRRAGSMPAQPSGAAGEAASGSRRGGFSLMDFEFKKPVPEEHVVTRFFLDLEAFRALKGN